MHQSPSGFAQKALREATFSEVRRAARHEVSREGWFPGNIVKDGFGTTPHDLDCVSIVLPS